MAHQIVYTIVRSKALGITLRAIGRSEMWPGNILVQKISAQGSHGLFSRPENDLEIIGEEAR